MQHDLDQLLIRRRRRHRLAAIVISIFLVALLLGVMRSCSSQFNEPYNKAYMPLDTSRKVEKEQR